ncbi:Phosphate transport system permease protein PstC [Clostridiaceae bacterium JG1575]|nr:Phosphate transport system permease protein PstC [Clostridiaceae bacterium JG1575]
MVDPKFTVSDPYQRRKKKTDQLFRGIFWFAGFLSAIFIVLIFVFIVRKGSSLFLPGYADGPYSLSKFLTGMQWRQDSHIYGVLFIIINTILSALGALILSFPISVLTALFIAKIAPKALSKVMTTIVELLAAIPSVVYGVFAAGSIVTWVDALAQRFGVSSFGGNSLLAVSILLAIMVFPTMTSLAIVAIQAVPKELTEGSLALGATPTQTNFKVVLTSAKSGIFAGLILGLGRAFGEATAVSMVAGNAMEGPTFNPFDITRTLTSTMLAGLKETQGIDYDVRFSVGIVLMVVILITNLAIHFVKNRIGGSMR